MPQRLSRPMAPGGDAQSRMPTELTTPSRRNTPLHLSLLSLTDHPYQNVGRKCSDLTCWLIGHRRHPCRAVLFSTRRARHESAPLAQIAAQQRLPTFDR